MTDTNELIAGKENGIVVLDANMVAQLERNLQELRHRCKQLEAAWEQKQRRIDALEKALSPIAAVWEDWLTELEKKGSPFETINRFAVYHLCGSQEDHFKNAFKVLEDEQS